MSHPCTAAQLTEAPGRTFTAASSEDCAGFSLTAAAAALAGDGEGDGAEGVDTDAPCTAAEGSVPGIESAAKPLRLACDTLATRSAELNFLTSFL